MIDLSTYHEGFVAGFFPGLGLGLGLMKVAWEHAERRSRMGPPRGRYGLAPDHDWRRSFNHENTNRPSEPLPLKFRRSGDAATWTNRPVKPEFPPPRKIRGDWP